MADETIDWDAMYAGDVPWDVGRPQDAVVSLAEDGQFAGHVLDAGCGTGRHAAFLAASGARVTGVDVSPKAAKRARSNARDVGVHVDFLAGDATRLPLRGSTVDVVLDTGLFHVFDAATRAVYANELARVTRPDGCAFLLAFADGAPTDWGPTPVHRDGFARAFTDGWTVTDIRESTFDATPHSVPAFLARADRTD